MMLDKLKEKWNGLTKKKKIILGFVILIVLLFLVHVGITPLDSFVGLNG